MKSGVPMQHCCVDALPAAPTISCREFFRDGQRKEFSAEGVL